MLLKIVNVNDNYDYVYVTQDETLYVHVDTGQNGKKMNNPCKLLGKCKCE